MMTKYAINDLTDHIINLIKGQGCNNYDLDNRDEYYNKTRDEQFREDLNYCIENEDQFREMLKETMGYYNEEEN